MRRRGSRKIKPAILFNGLTNYYKLESTSILNEKGASGVNNGATIVTGKIGNGVKVISGQNIDLGNVCGGLTEFAIGFWFKVDVNRTNNVLFGSGVNAINIRYNGTNVAISVFASSAAGVSFPTTIGTYTDGLYHFGIFEYISGGGFNGFIDGVSSEFTSPTAVGSVPQTNSYIGKNTSLTGDNTVDELFIYNRRLTNEEKAYWWNNGNGRTLP